MKMDEDRTNDDNIFRISQRLSAEAAQAQCPESLGNSVLGSVASDNGEWNRQNALALAMQWAGHDGASPEQIVEAAKVFASFIKGDDA